MMKFLFPLLLVSVLAAGCADGGSESVAYKTANGYFVRNDFDDMAVEMKIDSQEKFDSVFGMATTMSSRPTAIDFSKEYVVAVVLRSTDRETTISVDSLLWKGGDIDLYYSIEEGAPQSYTTRPAMLLVVDRRYEGPLDAVANSFTSNDEQVDLTVSGGKATATVEKRAGESVTFLFPAGDYTRLRGALSSPAADANIRFSQIVMPDGSADGPFGREIDYALDQRGTYKLIVNENIMAGDPWAGEFTVDIELSGAPQK